MPGGSRDSFVNEANALAERHPHLCCNMHVLRTEWPGDRRTVTLEFTAVRPAAFDDIVPLLRGSEGAAVFLRRVDLPAAAAAAAAADDDDDGDDGSDDSYE
jgi:hypothetical protein